MSTTPIDYTSLAKMYGATSSTPANGKVDYTALAAKFGGSTLPAKPQPSISDNPNGEGVYQMRSPQGQTVGVPYSKVGGAQGYNFANPQEQTRFQKDQSADPNSGVTHSAWSGQKIGSPLDAIADAGSHLANMVAGPVRALTAPPQNAAEVGAEGAMAANPFTPPRIGLAAYRMFAEPTVDNVSAAIDLRKKGGPQSSLLAPSRYDSAGNNVPTAGSKLVDAIPIYGPWARNAENEAQQKGILPAAAGLATDTLAPKLAGKIGGAILQSTGKTAELASATPTSAALWATRKLVPGTPGELLQSALKPSVTYGAGAANTLESSLPDVLTAISNPQGVSGFARAADAAKDAVYRPDNDLLSPYRPPVGGIGPVRPGAIAGAPIADRINASIPAINRFESSPLMPPRSLAPSDWTARSPLQPPEPSGTIARTAQRADLYRKDIPVSTADVLREDANAKLNAFYAKTGGDQNAALSNPETAAVKAIGDGTRAQLYPKLEADNGLQPGAVAAMQNKFGTLSNVADIANKREPVFARHDPMSLAQKVTLGCRNPFGTAYNYLLQKGVRSLTDSDAW